MLSHYFGAKLTQLSQAARSSSSISDSDAEEEEEAQAMDVSSSPKSARVLLGDEWADRLQQVLQHLQQLGLQVQCIMPTVECMPASMHTLHPIHVTQTSHGLL